MKKEDLERKVRRAESVCLTVIEFGRLISRRLDELEDQIRELKEAKQGKRRHAQAEK